MGFLGFFKCIIKETEKEQADPFFILTMLLHAYNTAVLWNKFEGQATFMIEVLWSNDS